MRDAGRGTWDAEARRTRLYLILPAVHVIPTTTVDHSCLASSAESADMCYTMVKACSENTPLLFCVGVVFPEQTDSIFSIAWCPSSA